MSLGTVLLVNIFPALLPPENPEDRDFYSVLDLPSKSVSEQEVRKAYKKKSLSLHPDKIAQRRENAITAEEAAREYQLVQEAHTCLADKASRQKYHAVRCSPTRYRFLTQGGGMGNHMGLLENLSNASFGDKTRLVLFVSTFPALLLLQPILIAVKVNHLLDLDGTLEDTSWVALLVPWWIFHGLFCIFWIMVAWLAPMGSKLPIAATAAEQLLWFISILLLALRWDQTISANYAAVLIPAYLASIIKWLHYVVTLQSITLDMSKMVSKNYFVDVILHGREPEELDEDELKELHEKYVVVSQIPLEVEASLEKSDADAAETSAAAAAEGEGAQDDDAQQQQEKLSDQEKEDIRVASSREFEHALVAYSQTRRTMIKSIIVDIVFVVLLILKVDDHRDISWWLVFLPIWVSYGLRMFHNCFVCCCSAGPMSADEVLIISKVREAMDTENDNNNNNNNNDGDENDNATEEAKDDKTAQEGTRPETKSEGNASEEQPISTGQSSSTTKLSEKTSLDTGSQKNANNTNTETGDGGGDVNNDEAKMDSSRKENTTGGDDEFSVHMDEEAYRAYRSAYAEAEADAMENRVRAGQNTCIVCIQLILILLFVIKLEKAYDAEEERDEQGDNADMDVGYNALWLLFPLFLIVGFMISCCACLIYGAPSPDELMQHKDEEQEDGGENSNDGNDEEANNNNGESSAAADSSPVVLAPPPPSGPATSAEEPPKEEEAKTAEMDSSSKKAEHAKETEQTKQTPPEEEPDDINDLD